MYIILVVSAPLKNDGVRQLRLWSYDIPNIWTVIFQIFQTTTQYVIEYDIFSRCQPISSLMGPGDRLIGNQPGLSNG
jgi:hypothetical protein